MRRNSQPNGANTKSNWARARKKVSRTSSHELEGPLAELLSSEGLRDGHQRHRGLLLRLRVAPHRRRRLRLLASRLRVLVRSGARVLEGAKPNHYKLAGRVHATPLQVTGTWEPPLFGFICLKGPIPTAEAQNLNSSEFPDADRRQPTPPSSAPPQPGASHGRRSLRSYPFGCFPP